MSIYVTERLMNKKVLLNLAVIAIAGSFGGLLAGYEMGIISGAQLFIVKEWNLSAQLLGYLVAIVMVGCFAGAFINGFLVLIFKFPIIAFCSISLASNTS